MCNFPSISDPQQQADADEQVPEEGAGQHGEVECSLMVKSTSHSFQLLHHNFLLYKVDTGSRIIIICWMKKTSLSLIFSQHIFQTWEKLNSSLKSSQEQIWHFVFLHQITK